MRLFLLPLSTRNTLLYCERIQAKVAAEQSYLDRITNKANTTWASWEASEPQSFLKGGWKKTVTTQGNKILRRIPYQEWGLKTLPPLNAKTKAALLERNEKVEILFPEKYLEASKIEGVLEKLATERQALHRKRLIWCFIGMPVVAPFALVPVIPNIPFFYLAFRAYSHWKALAGSKHIQFLLETSLYKKTPSTDLDEVYTAGLSNATREEARAAPALKAEQITSVLEAVKAQTKGNTKDAMVLKQWNGKLIAERFKLPEMEVEIERAVEQVEKELKSKEEENEKTKPASGSTKTDKVSPEKEHKE